MRYITRCILPAVAVVFFCSAAVQAESFNPFNDRQPAVPVSSTPAYGDSLQSILDQIYGPGAVNANTDQEPAGMWRTSAYRFPTVTPVMQFRFGPNASSDSFGIWSATSNTPGSITAVTLFNGGAAPGSAAMMQWDTTGKLNVCSGTCNQYTGINPLAFGFFIDTPTGRFYTLDALNPGGSTQALTYLHNAQDGAGEWVIAFNDVLTNGGGDFNHLVVSIESITALPEPSSIALFGTSLLVVGGILRRRLAPKKNL